MNLQLFGYDDGFYYGQCKLIFEAETVSDNGKTVTISDGTTTKSGIVANKKCEFIVPGRSLWTATLLDSTGDPEWIGKAEAGYGDCKHIMLADGYESVMERDVLTLEEIKAATNLDGYIPNAEAIKKVDNKMGGLRLGQKDSEYGYFTGEGADTFIPFSTLKTNLYSLPNKNDVTTNVCELKPGKHFALVYINTGYQSCGENCAYPFTIKIGEEISFTSKMSKASPTPAGLNFCFNTFPIGGSGNENFFVYFEFENKQRCNLSIVTPRSGWDQGYDVLVG